MESLVLSLAKYGYPILFLVVFMEAMGIPIPAALGLLIAGGACARGSMQFGVAWAGTLAVMVFADGLMFLLGKLTGWWLLGILCRLSLNPESCILRAADSFYKRGRVLLVFAKFLPGMGTLAPPLAGSMNMRYRQFFWLDLAGATLYSSAYLGLGYLFSDALGAMTKGYQALGTVVTYGLGAAVIGYVGAQFWMWFKARGLRSMPFVKPQEAAEAIAGGGAIVYDVRSHGYYDPNAMRIPGSKRLDPNALNQIEEAFPSDRTVYLYCTCVREATSARVASALLNKGVHSLVIQGGLRAWKKAGLPLEKVPAEEIATLPVFQ